MKQKIKHYFQTVIFPFLIQLFVRFIYFTNKKVFHHVNIDQTKNYVVAFWHGDLLMQPFNYKKLRPNNEIRAMISEHRDGESIQKTVAFLGIGSISGSSSKGGAKALISAIRTLKKGVDVGITPDGPRGPIYSIADGIVAISQKTQAQILPFSSKPSKYWTMSSWDKFIIPKPFGTIEFFVGEPFDLEGLEMEDAKKIIYDKMMENRLDK
jgi:lysophospholipid acyltransferase (LPLAT)-like uncharacterized protein